ncbi:hypothetical protein BN165_1040049 [Clostridioides difficile E1]|nr:hypothetical protein BN163_1130050 [Clostridioides difficile T5]CCK94180.1 hypothetical protein BN165_1040049 [Clostridioides difficile E1]
MLLSGSSRIRKRTACSGEWVTGQGAMPNSVSWQPEVHRNGSLPESIR